MIGTTRDEMHLFNALDPSHVALDDSGMMAAFERRFPGRADAAIAAYRAVRPDHSPGQLRVGDADRRDVPGAGAPARARPG